jgi:formylglycine-generating enzyme required for sulfatase activity
VCDGLDNDCDGMTDEPRATPGNHPSYVKDSMIALDGDVWIYTYEASRPDATKDDAGVGEARACSKKNALPWADVGFAAARAACEAAGYRLCSGAEWLRACEGSAQSTYPYGSSYAANTCNGADHDISKQSGLQNGPLASGNRSDCVSEANVYDLSGNLKEWTDDPRGDVDGSPIEVVRGGSYESPALGLSCQTELSQQIATTALPSLGFRCCSDDEP